VHNIKIITGDEDNDSSKLFTTVPWTNVQEQTGRLSSRYGQLESCGLPSPSSTSNK